MKSGADLAEPPRAGGGRLLGVGIDLVEVSQIAESLRHFPERFARRLFTAAEATDCWRSGPRAPEGFATRFAAKEAAMKALGLAEGIDWRELEVVAAADGSCALCLHGEVARRAGACTLALSLAIAGDLATALVVAERLPTRRGRGSRRLAEPTPGIPSSLSFEQAHFEQTHSESNQP